MSSQNTHKINNKQTMDTSSLPQAAITTFIHATQELTGGVKSSKEAKERKLAAKMRIVQFMQESKMSYIQVDHLFLCLKTTTKSPTVNSEFLASVYKEFETNQRKNFIGSSIEQLAAKFSEFIQFMRKKNSENSFDLRLTKKKPMSAMLFESFNGSSSSF